MRRDPSQHESSRYLGFRIHSEKKIEFEELVKAIWDEFLDFAGVLSTSEADLWVIKNMFNREKQRGVIKVNSDLRDNLEASLNFIDKVDGEDVIVEVTDVSGTIKSLKQRN